ncbi:MAG: GNAT family N-acetyltransferase [Oceanospirillaceae bacterium]|nr:GNAT family N-acetyltransferase [Oceanospirillaceae bacterium]
MPVTIEKINPLEAQHLINELDAYQSTLYPPDSLHLDSAETLSTANVSFYGAKENEQIIAIGAVKMFEDYGEIKRIYVPVAHRGKQLAQKIMAVLESELLAKQIYCSRLETGPASKDAISLYSKLGYIERGPFGSYKPDPLSTFMEKKLDAKN